MMSWMRSNCKKFSACTHLSMGNVKGSFTVPSGLDEVFLMKYSKAIRNGEQLSLTEVKTQTFHLFADLDWVEEGDELDDEKLLEVAKFVSQQAFLIFAPTTSEHSVVIATRQPVMTQSGGHKNGMHIHWPGILATAPSAQVFRRTSVERCRERFGEGFMAGKPWEGVIDEHVFKGSGLRMLYSSKQVERDVYRPRWHLIIRLQESEGFKQAKIQEVVAVPLADMESEDKIQHWVGMCMVRYKGHSKTPLQACIEEMEEKQASEGSKESVDIMEHHTGLEALKRILPECYRSCTFVKLVRQDNKAFITPNTRVCLNLVDGGSHKSNNVYFVVDRTSTYQACFCSCDTSEGRVRGPCKDFRSNHFPTPPELAQSLFPQAAVPFSCNGACFTTPQATPADIFDKFFKASHKPMKKRARKARK